MSDLQPKNMRVWDRFFDLLYECDESVSDSEVDADLQRAGIDMRPANARLRQLIEQHKARALLAEARESRVSVMDRIRDVVAPKVENLREGIKELVDRLFAGSELVAQHHKLEKTASDEDLESMMDDLTKLAKLREQKKDEATPK